MSIWYSIHSDGDQVFTPFTPRLSDLSNGVSISITHRLYVRLRSQDTEILGEPKVSVTVFIEAPPILQDVLDSAPQSTTDNETNDEVH